MVGLTAMKPVLGGPLEGSELAAWLVAELFVSHKLMAVFVLLIGMGMVHSDAAGHRQRMWSLGVIGILHTLLLARGDVLFTHALSGMLVYRARDWPVRKLI